MSQKSEVSSKQIRASRGPRLPIRSLWFHSRSRVTQLFTARDPLLRDQALEDQLARRNHRGRVLFRREPRVVDDGEQPRHHAEALETRLGALVGVDLQGAALV